MEGYAESQGSTLEQAHDYANWYFGGLDPGGVKGATYGVQNGMVLQLTANFLVHGSSATEQITMHFVTPVPEQDFVKGKGAPYAQYPTNVQTVGNKK